MLRWVVRLARIVAATAASTLLGWMALGLTPSTWWIEEARFARPADAFEVVDRNGVVLRHARQGGIDRRWIALHDVDPKLIDAFIAAEDARFRSHDGVDGLALVRGIATTLRPWGRRSGGSTISQQVVKLVYGRPHGIFSKALEMVRSRALEQTLGKDEILEQYLNRVPFGDRIAGVARASEEYFGHSAAEVSVAEAALLAGIPQAPSATEPRRHFVRAQRRAHYVLGRMATLGLIDEETRDRSAAAMPTIRAIPPRPSEAPRFVDAALRQWRSGKLDRHGADLHTSLDLELQRDVDRLLASAVDRFASRGVTNAAAVVVAHDTGEIVAYTGAARRNASGGSLDLLTRRRGPGSTLKPFAYELFFERGGSAASVLDDIALPRTGAAGVSVDPKDYDGRERGPVRARVALSASLNLAALDVAGRVGQDALIDRFVALGFRNLGAASRYGAGAVLGGVDVAPIDLAAAYVALARGGTRIALTMTASRRPAVGDRVMTAAASETVRDILSDARARSDAFGSDLQGSASASSGGGGRGVERFALKTGTSSGWRDAWAALFDDTFTIIVWMGDPEGRPMGGVSGFEASAPVAAAILARARTRAYVNGAKAAEGEPLRLVTVAVCAATGLRVGAGCRHSVQERFAPDAWPSETCASHDEHGDVVLPARYESWVRRYHPSGVARTFSEPAASDEGVVIREPRDGARWLVDLGRGATTVPLRARVGATDIGDASWSIDGKNIPGAAWELSAGDHTVVAQWRGRKSRPVNVHVETATIAR